MKGEKSQDYVITRMVNNKITKRSEGKTNGTVFEGEILTLGDRSETVRTRNCQNISQSDGDQPGDEKARKGVESSSVREVRMQVQQ